MRKLQLRFIVLVLVLVLAPVAALVPAAPVRASIVDRQTRSHTAVPTAHLSYWGGPLIPNAKVVVVVWGRGRYLAQVTAAAAPNIASFVSTLTRSSYVDWLAEYDANGTHIGRGRLGGRYTIGPSTRNNGTSVDDVRNLRPELVAQIRAGHLPAPDRNTIYLLLLRTGQVVTQGGQDSVHAFCAYHETVRARGLATIRYAVVPASASGVGCGPRPGFGNVTISASHEIVETITDPDVGFATRLGAPLGWYDVRNGEIADICEGTTATLVGTDAARYVVQELWSNRRRKCVAR